MLMTATQALTGPDVAYLVPEILLVGAAIVLTVLDLLLPNTVRRGWISWLTLASLAGAAAAVIGQFAMFNPFDGDAEVVSLLSDSYRIDGFALVMKLVILTASMLILLMGIRTIERDDAIPDKGETFTMMLPAVTGALVLCSTADLITMFVGLELLGISTYVMIGFRKKSSLASEAAFKYIVIGAVSSAIILFGMSYLYGVTGSTNLGWIAWALEQAAADYQALVYVALFFIVAGFAVKIAAVPFHAWAPDVYQGAATPVTAFLAVVSKAAAFIALVRVIFNTAVIQTPFILGPGVSPVGEDVLLALKVLAAAAMIVGTTAALRQKNVKRLLALSGVANAGYLLVPLAIGIGSTSTNNLGDFAFYLVAYLFMTIGAFAVMAVVGRAAGHDELKGYAGLYYRAPWTAAGMVVLLVSLAGLPVTGGFFGKLFILLSAVQMKDYWLAAIMVVTSVISYYFYFSIIRQMFMRTAETEAKLSVPAPTGIVAWICVVATLALGFLPNAFMDMFEQAVTLSRDIWIAVPK
ncbi:MAG: NADH:ubiquinone oxidoreductase subunit N [Thermobacillus sp. ZCTH02-B1]|uniref:NADH-quinone oxidoreductase subunit N n=1 Tax=Thermobacillus sp. ZCTH02-B1 TaxID=1858795 RepID=UPI000B560D50|nr:NADH-quinone oxidoreductase subunit N [Thermobacillus sp. ZCTH02-B1]OUM94939.1 MAG: NADH:ubiquinone oxidoreductase subunit N [Thermobacillus sp. ZCTH02-B1]